MIDFKKIVEPENNQVGYSFIILWLFSVTLSYNIIRGDHITIGLGAGPLEVSLGLSIWRKLLPWKLDQQKTKVKDYRIY